MFHPDIPLPGSANGIIINKKKKIDLAIRHMRTVRRNSLTFSSKNLSSKLRDEIILSYHMSFSKE